MMFSVVLRVVGAMCSVVLRVVGATQCHASSIVSETFLYFI